MRNLFKYYAQITAISFFVFSPWSNLVCFNNFRFVTSFSDRVAGMDFPRTAGDILTLKDQGIGLIIKLDQKKYNGEVTAQLESLQGSIQVKEYLIKDMQVPENVDAMVDTFNQMISFLKANPTKKIAVHCTAGQGRTGLFVACWVAYINHEQNSRKVIEFVRRCDLEGHRSIETPAQEKFIDDFCKHFEQTREPRRLAEDEDV